MGLFANLSGIKRLAEQYPVKEQAEGNELVSQTVQFGSIRYRNCVRIIISPKGIYLRITPPLGSNYEMLIPWGEIVKTSVSSLYGSKAMQIHIGNPEKDSLTVYNKLFDLIQPYLETK